MAQPKAAAARAAAVPMPGADIAAELDGLAATAPPARPPMVVIGHRGMGMNALASPDARLRGDVRENTLRSFNAAAGHPGVAYVEFDVQVTKDGCPVIFHDNFIYTEHEGEISGRRVTELRLDEFLSYGPQRKGHHGTAAGKKPLLRKLKDGRIVRWDVRREDALCTLSEALESVDRRVGFNVELKFDDGLAYADEELAAALRAVLDVVSAERAGGDRPIVFSSFHPDAARLLREMQGEYPVYFLTNGGTQTYADERRNSLEEAVRLCAAAGLQGVVSEVRAVLRHPEAVAMIKMEAKLALMTYGQLNNVPEVVYVQHLMGVDGVIVDLVREIADAVSAFTAVQESSAGSVDEDGVNKGDQAAALQAATAAAARTPSFSPREMSFLLRLIPELVQ
ncbi:hypothetical protein U9M48_032313 [Paspalum notatum var. saurae]|uniref:glycerophosphodiester phosphodiesterase n=1 Tax=Paspalum notatum var. saurae TaxID=547442 RepID=A0AAQ3X4N4_PASNO